MRASGRVYIRERKRGDQWYMQYRVNGRRFNRRLGPVWREKGRPPASYFTKRKAEQALEAILTDARRGDLVLPDPVRDGKTYRDACDEWLRYVEQEKDRAAGTVRDYRTTAYKRLVPYFGADTPVSSITTEQIDTLTETLLEEGVLSRRTVQKTMVFNYGILKRAKRKGWIPTNPAEDAERVTVERSGDFNVLTPDEVFTVAAKAGIDLTHEEAEMYSVLIVVAAFTGLRMGELLALRWMDVDFVHRTVFVRRNYVRGVLKKPKSKRIRSVPLIDQAAAALDRLSRRANFTGPTDLVFASITGTFLDSGDVRSAFYDALDAAGLGYKRKEDPPLRFHDLRHTFGTLGAKVWPLSDLQEYMGHADIKTTMIYVHHVPKDDAADALTALVGSASSPAVPVAA
jgi:integrase